MEKETVMISLEAYRDYVINQYERGLYKNSLQEYIKALEKEKQSLEESFENLKCHTQDFRDSILSLGFDKNSFDYRSRRDMTNYQRYTFGFDSDAVKVYETLGFTMDELIQYINKQFDLKETIADTEEINE